MPINTKSVHGRRHLTFQSLDEVVADAEKLAVSPNTKMLGNWPLGQLLMHLTTTINHSIDGISFTGPWYIRLIAPLFKKRFLTKPMPVGFNLPKEAEPGFFPAASSLQEAFEQLRTAVARTHNERMTATHPVLGKMKHEEWQQLHLRHSELHLSFAVPG
jgi:hypothetical protein